MQQKTLWLFLDIILSLSLWWCLTHPGVSVWLPSKHRGGVRGRLCLSNCLSPGSTYSCFLHPCTQILSVAMKESEKIKDLSAQQKETGWNQTVKNLFHVLNLLFTSVSCSYELITDQLIFAAVETDRMDKRSGGDGEWSRPGYFKLARFLKRVFSRGGIGGGCRCCVLRGRRATAVSVWRTWWAGSVYAGLQVLANSQSKK